MRIASGTRIGRYTVEKLIGSGGMGDVYLAHDEQLARPVALKLLTSALRHDREFQQRLHSEARAASALNHPNILTVHEIGEADGEHFIATEFVDGVTLRHKVGALPLLHVVRIIEDVAAALSAAEDAGIVHRDIKPDNVMIRRDGYVKVLDFGLARRVSSTDAAGPNLVSGTVHYMSPEQLQGQQLDSRSDVWSLGVLLCELATGRRPFEGESAMDVINAIMDRAHGSTEGPPELQAIVRRALQKERRSRFATMNEMLGALRAARRQLEKNSQDWTSTIVDADVAQRAEVTPVPTPIPTPVARRRSNLPILLTTLVGRAAEVAAVRALLAREDVRLVTLTGPGGTGKTRLGLEVALELMSSYRSGVFFVPLAAVRESSAVPDMIARALEIREDAGGSLLDTIKREVANDEMLLLLDNLEQVLGCGPLLVELLESVPGLKILVTSQASLRLRGEFEHSVPPLALPLEGEENATALAVNPAIELFVQRAQATDARFVLTEENAAAVASICMQLDGLPLAIELAAARVKLMSPRQILGRLDRRLGLLTGGARDLPSRQQTMHAAISWGYELLDDADRRLLGRFSVFAGGASLEAVEAVCGDGGNDAAPGLGTLVERSFIRRDESGSGDPRFVMLGTIREYGLEQLAASGEEEAVRRAHARWFQLLAEEAAAMLQVSGQGVWIDRLEVEHENLQAALQWAVSCGDHSSALRMAGSLWWFWYVRGYYALGRRSIEQVLAAREPVEERHRGPALLGAGVLAFLQCDYDQAAERLEAAARLADSLDDRRTFATAVQFLGSIARERGSYARSLARHRLALEHCRELGDRAGEARSLNYIAFASWLSGDYDSPGALCAEASSIFRTLGDEEGMSWSTINLAAIATCRNEQDRAMALAKEALASARATGFKEGIAWSLNILGDVSRRRGQNERASGFLRKSFDHHWELGDRWRSASVLESLAGVRVDEGDFEAAALLLGAASSLREHIGAPVPPCELPVFEADVAKTRKALGDARYEEHLVHGARTSIHTILKYRIETL